MQTRIVVSTANPVTEICDGQAYARYYLCFYLFPATDYCLKPRLRKFFRHLQQTALFPLAIHHVEIDKNQICWTQ